MAPARSTRKIGSGTGCSPAGMRVLRGVICVLSCPFPESRRAGEISSETDWPCHEHRTINFGPPNLRGPIYGMRSGSRLWYNTLAEWLISRIATRPQARARYQGCLDGSSSGGGGYDINLRRRELILLSHALAANVRVGRQLYMKLLPTATMVSAVDHESRAR